MADPVLHHVLAVERLDDDTLDLHVEHDPLCPFEEDTFPEGMIVRYYTCAVGEQVSHDGLESFDRATLEPGRYPIEAWYEPGRWYGANWSDPDGGLRLVESAA